MASPFLHCRRRRRRRRRRGDIHRRCCCCCCCCCCSSCPVQEANRGVRSFPFRNSASPTGRLRPAPDTGSRPPNIRWISAHWCLSIWSHYYSHSHSQTCSRISLAPSLASQVSASSSLHSETASVMTHSVLSWRNVRASTSRPRSWPAPHQWCGPVWRCWPRRRSTSSSGTPPCTTDTFQGFLPASMPWPPRCRCGHARWPSPSVGASLGWPR